MNEVNLMNTNSRYILFGFDRHYPAGGMSDALLSFNSKAELRAKTIELGLENDYKLYQVFDISTFCSYQERSPLDTFEALESINK